MSDNFEVREEDTIEEILKAGGSVSISARWQLAGKLVQLANLANATGATLWLWDTDNFTTQELVSIAHAGQRNVVIDVRISKNEVARLSNK